jgi:hypothetical protein
MEGMAMRESENQAAQVVVLRVNSMGLAAGDRFGMPTRRHDGPDLTTATAASLHRSLCAAAMQARVSEWDGDHHGMRIMLRQMQRLSAEMARRLLEADGERVVIVEDADGGTMVALGLPADRVDAAGDDVVERVVGRRPGLVVRLCGRNARAAMMN